VRRRDTRLRGCGPSADADGQPQAP